MSDLTFGFRNIDGVIRNLYAADPIAVDAMKKSTRKSGTRAYNMAQDLCPVDEGLMKENIKLEFTPEELFWELGWDERDFEAAGLPPYFIYQELGTSRNAAQPSITPAWFAEQERFPQELGRDISDALERRRAP